MSIATPTSLHWGHFWSFTNEHTGDSLSAIAYSPVLPYLLRQCKTRSEIMPRLYALRNSKGATAVRKRMREHAAAVQAGDLKSAVKLSAEMSRVSNYFRSDIGLPASGPECTVGVSALTVPLPDRLVQYAIRKAEGILHGRTLFIHDIFKAFASAAALGRGYELLTRGNDILPRADGWSQNELRRHTLHCYRRARQRGETPHGAKTCAYQLVRRLNPGLSAMACWREVIDACGPEQ